MGKQNNWNFNENIFGGNANNQQMPFGNNNDNNDTNKSQTPFSGNDNEENSDKPQMPFSGKGDELGNFGSFDKKGKSIKLFADTEHFDAKENSKLLTIDGSVFKAAAKFHSKMSTAQPNSISTAKLITLRIALLNK